MSRIYRVAYNGTITNSGGNTDLLEALPADDKPILLRGMLLSQSSEVKDAEEENLRITVQRFPATVTSGSGGSSVTPQSGDSVDAAAGFAAECNNTTVATTSSTAVVLDDFNWNIRNSPFDFWWPDRQFCPVIRQGEALIVRLESTVADDLTGSFTFYVEEI